MDLIHNRTLDSAPISTLAFLAALPGPPQRVRQYLEETDAPYEFVPGDVTAVDGWTVIAPTGGAAGRWLIRSDRISIAPLGGAADDWPRLLTALQACAGRAVIFMRAGTWLCKTAWASPGIPSNTELHASSGVTIVSSLVPTGGAGGFSQSPFYANRSTVGAPGSLSVQSVEGGNTISSTISVAPGATLTYSNATNLFQQATVISIAGGGPFTLTLDEVVEYTIPAAGSIVQQCTVPTNIKLYGNGATITGTGDRGIELGFGRLCVVEGWNITRSQGVFEAAGISLDTASRDCIVRQCTVDGGFGVAAIPTHFGIGLEVTVRCYAEDCYVRYIGSVAGDVGFFVPSARLSSLVRCKAENGAALGAVLTTTGGADNAGCRRCSVIDCDFERNQDGLQVDDGARDIDIVGTRADFNTRYGFRVLTFVGVPERIRFNGASATGNTTSGFRIENASKVSLDNVAIVGQTVTGLDLAAGSAGQVLGNDVTIESCSIGISNPSTAVVRISGLSTKDNTTSDAVLRGGSQTYVSGYDGVNSVIAANGILWDIDGGVTTYLCMTDSHFRVSTAGFIGGVVVGGGPGTGGRADLHNVIIERTVGTAGAAVYAVATAKILVGAGCRTIGAYANGCYAVDNTSHIRVSDDVNFSSCTAPFASGGAQSPNGGPPSYNFGIVQLTANVAAPVAFADIRGNQVDRVVLQRQIVAGGTGLAPLCVTTPGTGFAVTSVVADTDTYGYKIV